MERILLSEDKRGLERALKVINSDLAIYNKLVEVIKQNTDRVSVTMENIHKLLADPKGFFFDLLVDKSQMNFNGLPINKKKAIELVDFPKEFNAIISESVSAKAALTKYEHATSSDTTIDRLSINNINIVGEHIVCNPEYLNELKDQFRSYTRNENQNEALKLMQQFDLIIEGLLRIGFIQSVRELENLGLTDLGFKFYDHKRSIDFDQIRRIRS